MVLIVNGALWLFLALVCAYGIYDVVNTFRATMRELEQRDLRAARRHSKPV